MNGSFRITTVSGKVGTVIVAVIIITMVGIVGAMVDFDLGYLAAVAVTVVLVVVTTRLFRGASESLAPRAWWQMTATPAIGYLLGALFLIQGIGIVIALIAGAAPAVVCVGAAVSVTLAAAYAHSSARLSVRRSADDEPAKS